MSEITGQDEARRALADRLSVLIQRARQSETALGFRGGAIADLGAYILRNEVVILAALRAPSQDRGAEEWQPIADKPPEADWIVYLPDGAADGLGWALNPDEKLAALLWWEATSPTLSEITHFRKPIAGPSALAQQAKGEGEGGD